MKKISLLFFLVTSCICPSCTYNITQVQTRGTAQDVIDDTDTTSVKANASIPISTSPGANSSVTNTQTPEAK